MCGVIPATVALVAALELGAQRSRLVRYTNSGEVSGDFNRVVGYAGMVIS
jgi:AmmeMemoRadiSam system protein B